MTRLSRAAAGTATALAFLTAPVQALDLNAMSAAEREAFGAQVREYLMENPEVIIEAVSLLEQRQAANEAARDEALVTQYLSELENDGYSYVGGNPEGDITLVEFMDYRCGYCRRAAPEVAELLAEDGNIRWVVKEFPILGEASVLSSRFAVATKQIAGDKAYKEVHEALMGMTGEPGEVALRRLADGLGLDTEAILARMDSEEVTTELRQTRDLAQKLSISGTPTFVLGGELLRGYLPKDQMELVVKEVRQKRQ